MQNINVLINHTYLEENTHKSIYHEERGKMAEG